MPSRTTVEHEVTRPRVPWIFTRQSRHAPVGVSFLCQQRLGIGMPAACAASSRRAPARARTSFPSIFRLTNSLSGIRVSLLWALFRGSLDSLAVGLAGQEHVRKMSDDAPQRENRGLAERAERGPGHHLSLQEH